MNEETKVVFTLAQANQMFDALNSIEVRGIQSANAISIIAKILQTGGEIINPANTEETEN